MTSPGPVGRLWLVRALVCGALLVGAWLTLAMGSGSARADTPGAGGSPSTTTSAPAADGGLQGYGQFRGAAPDPTPPDSAGDTGSAGSTVPSSGHVVAGPTTD